MAHRSLLRALGAMLLVVSLVLAVTSRAGADETRRGGRVRLVTPSGAGGPLELRPDGDGYAAELLIVNAGAAPLVVSRLLPREGASDLRGASRLTARLAEGSLPVTIAPGTSRSVVARHRPDPRAGRGARFGHVVVATSDEAAGEVAMGVRVPATGPLGPADARVLSLLVGAPVLGAVLVFLLGGSARRARRVTVAALGIQVLFAGYVRAAFSPAITRADGNDGLQFLERVAWARGLPVELSLAVDGIGANALLVLSVVALAAVVAERAPRSARHHAALLVLEAAAAGAIIAMDGLVFVALSLMAVLATSLVVGAGGARAVRVALPGVVAIVLLAVAITSAARAAEPTFLVDGTGSGVTFSVPELSRARFEASGATLLGAPLAKAGFALTLAASILLLAAFPGHRWLGGALASAGAPAGILAASAPPLLGLVALLRIGCGVFPEGMRWASGIVVALGAVSAAYGALLALGERDLRAMAAHATTSHAGFILLGAGSLTPQGFSGAIALGTARPLACALFLLVASVAHERTRTSDARRLAGVGAQMPGLVAALGVAALAQGGALGALGAWGPSLALFGVLPGYAPLAAAGAIALALLAAAHLWIASSVAFGDLDPAWAESPMLEPFGGRFPSLSARERAGLGALAVIVVALGLFPAPILAPAAGTARDLAGAVSPPGPGQIALR